VIKMKKIETNPHRTCGFCRKFSPNIPNMGSTTVDYIPICRFHQGQIEQMHIHSMWRNTARDIIKSHFSPSEINRHRLEGEGTPICDVSHHHYWTNHKFITDDNYALCIYCFIPKIQLEGEEEE